MTEQPGNTADGARFEIGLDGKPYEVWSRPGGGGGTLAVPPTAMDESRFDVSHPASHGMTGGYVPPANAPSSGLAETSVLMTERRSMEFDHLAWYSLGLGGFAFVAQGISWLFVSGGMPWIVAFGFAGAGLSFGIRSHNASLRGLCTNGRLGRVGMAISVLAALVTAAMIVRVVLAFGAGTAAY